LIQLDSQGLDNLGDRLRDEGRFQEYLLIKQYEARPNNGRLSE
jgi:hypothetical protein